MVLPAPLGPRRVWIVPASRERLMPRNTVSDPHPPVRSMHSRRGVISPLTRHNRCRGMPWLDQGHSESRPAHPA